MTRTILNLAVAFLLAVHLAGEEARSETNNEASGDGIKFTELGINLYGKFIFESEGELFALSDKGSKELVPPGAVLVCIRQAYSIGYFAEGATVTDGAKTFKASKIFFVLKPDGKVTFYLPSPDGNFFGEQIPNTIVFDALYKPKKN